MCAYLWLLLGLCSASGERLCHLVHHRRHPGRRPSDGAVVAAAAARRAAAAVLRRRVRVRLGVPFQLRLLQLGRQRAHVHRPGAH